MNRTVVALATFLKNRELWVAGQQKEVSQSMADELLKAGLVQEVGETEAAPAAEVSPASAHKLARREKKPAAVQLETK